MEEKTNDNQGKNVKDLLTELIEIQKKANETSEKKPKLFKLPGRAKPSQKQLKDGFAIIGYVNGNKEVDFTKLKLDEGAVRKLETFHVATADYAMSYNKMPFFWIPSWDTEPWNPSKSVEEAERLRRTTMGQRFVYNKMRNDAISDVKKGINMLWIGVGALVVIGLVWYLQTHGVKLF